MSYFKLLSHHSLSAVVALMVMGGALLIGGCVQQPVPVGESRAVTLTDANFATLALEGDKPMLVDFGATWCGPCRQMEPVVASLSVEYADRLKVGKVDVDESSQLAVEYGIKGVPTFIVFRDGKEFARLTGGLGKQDFTAWVEQQLAD